MNHEYFGDALQELMKFNDQFKIVSREDFMDNETKTAIEMQFLKARAEKAEREADEDRKTLTSIFGYLAETFPQEWEARSRVEESEFDTLKYFFEQKRAAVINEREFEEIERIKKIMMQSHYIAIMMHYDGKDLWFEGDWLKRVLPQIEIVKVAEE